MKQIEFFGLSGSGKTYLKNKLIKKLKEKNFISLSYKDVIRKYLFNEEKNVIKRNFIWFYLNFKNLNKSNSKINNKKIKINIKYTNSKDKSNLKKKIVNLYLSKIDNTYKKYKSKNKKFVNLVEKLILNSNFNFFNKEIIKRWFKEETVAKYLIKKYQKKINYIVDSEGLIQRINIYAYKKKNKRKIISEYLDSCPLPDLIFITKKKIFKKKLFTNKEMNLNINEQKIIYDLVINKIRLKKINIKKISQKTINNFNYLTEI